MEKNSRNYNLHLLLTGIALLLLQLSSLTLQNYYGSLALTSAPGFDTFIIIALSALFIVQPFKKNSVAASIVLLFFGLVNVIYALSSSSYYIRNLVNPDYQVFFSLALVLAFTTYLIAALFLLLHSLKPRFETILTKKIVGGILAISLILLVLAGVLVIPGTVPFIISLVVFILSFGALYVAMIFLIEDPVIEPVVGSATVALNQLERLYNKGLITKDEYEERKKSLS